MLETFKPTLASKKASARAIRHLPTDRALREKEGATVNVTLNAELDDLRWACKEMTQTVFLKGCHQSAWNDEIAQRVTVQQPQLQIAIYRSTLFPNWTDLVYSFWPDTSTGKVP